MATVMACNMQPNLLTRRSSSSLSLDLSDLPALTQPSPPSNTLLITNLQSLEIFASSVLESIRSAINDQATIHTFAPLKSFRRIVVSFYTIEDAIKIRQLMDNEVVLNNRVRIYFGQPTNITTEDQHLQAPKSQKLFFISPPPSPPVGWTMRNEDPPNKEVHADDLAAALANLHARPSADEALREDNNDNATRNNSNSDNSRKLNGISRQRTSSLTLVYHPEDHGHSADLPAIAVEDTSASPGDLTPMEGVEKKFIHTSRPPVELMES